MEVWLNGQFVHRDEAKVSAFDAGFQHGVGLFETMTAANGCVFRAADHMRRLASSAKELLLTDQLRIEPLIEAVRQTVVRQDLDRARVRLTLTGGDLNLLQTSGERRHDPTILIVAQPPTAYPESFFESGVRVMIADSRANPFEPSAGHKTLNYWPRLSALQAAASRGVSEALWFSVTNHLVSGSVSNVFIIRDGRLFTPIARGEEVQGAIPSPVLPGITRGVMCEIAEHMGVEVVRQMLTIEDALRADEIVLTNSSWGVLPVIGIEREEIADGAVGDLARALRHAWLERVHSETS